MEKKFIGCTVKTLSRSQWQAAAKAAREINRANGAAVDQLSSGSGAVLHPDHLALLTAKYWGAKGVKLSVSFLDNPSQALRSKLLAHMNAWRTVGHANVSFTEVPSGGQVRIARNEGDGYWSYLGTDVLQIPANEPTMNLDSFSEGTPDSEFYRVVRHETGHTLGWPHEHLRQELVSLLDRAKTIAYFGRNQGWNEQTVIDQVLTPLDPASIRATTHADSTSIMCYDISGECTMSGEPIPGGVDIDAADAAFAASQYPLAVTPPPPPPPPPGPPPSVSVIAAVDKAFAALETALAGRPVLLHTVQFANIWIDTYLRAHGVN